MAAKDAHRILIIEDDNFFREMYTKILKDAGYESDSASCGLEGLSKFAAYDYGLVITDLVMPDVNGMEILSKVKESNPSVDVIMVTGNADIKSAIYALKHGARDYLIKPINPDELLHSISLCMEQRRIVDENEELKNTLHLLQASQTLSGCLEVDRVYHLLVDTIAREVGVSRAIGFSFEEGVLEIKESREIQVSSARALRNRLVPAEVSRFAPMSFNRFRPPGSRIAAIDEAYLIPIVLDDGIVTGLICLCNDPGKPLPEIRQKSNICFLLEQAVHALGNASRFSTAKDMLFIDELSGLFNYRYLEIALDREMKRAERYASQLAVLFLDIDSFKSVNDRHGHLVGSDMLKQVGSLLKKSVRDVDVVIRYGGDEFTVILVETVPGVAATIAERIRKAIDDHSFILDGDTSLHLTVSIGYACYPVDAANKQQLMEMADKAMYAGKSEGKNRIYRISQGNPPK